MTTENNNQKKKLSKDELSDFSGLFAELLNSNDEIHSAKELLFQLTGSERIELFKLTREFCKVKNIKLPANRLINIFLNHPKLTSTIWANYFCSIYRMVAFAVDDDGRDDVRLMVFRNALNYYRKPEKGYANLTSLQLGDFMLNCPDASRWMLICLEEALQLKDYTFLQVFGTAVGAMFQEKAGTGKLAPEIAGQMLEKMSSVPINMIPQELFAIFPALCLRSQQIPDVFRTSDIAEQLRLRMLYPCLSPSNVISHPEADKIQAESIAVMLESVPAFIRRLYRHQQDNEKENGKLKQNIEEFGKKLEEYRSKCLRYKTDLTKKDDDIERLENKLIVVENDIEVWRNEHSLLEKHSVKELEFNNERLLADIKDKFGGQLINMRDNINRVLDSAELAGTDIQSLAAAFNSLCSVFNRVTSGDITRIENEKIRNFKTKHSNP